MILYISLSFFISTIICEYLFYDTINSFVPTIFLQYNGHTELKQVATRLSNTTGFTEKDN